MRTLALVPALFASCVFGQNGIIVTVAGNGTYGPSGVGGPAVNAGFSPAGLCVDKSDNLYIADIYNNRVLEVDAVSGILTLVAGNGTASSAGDYGPATQASLNRPFGVTVDSTGNIFISEQLGSRVRRIDAVTQIITTVAGNGVAAFAGDGAVALRSRRHNQVL